MADVEYRREGHVAYVRLNRPQALNAINSSMNEALLEAWHEVNGDPEVWVALLSAEGERAFCAGADVSGQEDATAPRIAFGGGLTGVGGELLRLRKPLVAAVQGHVLGGGFELVLCADVIVAADNVKFGMPETKVGIIGESGIMHRAVRQLPYRIALAMLMTGDRMEAEAALRHGLVNEVVSFEQLMPAAAAWADKITAASPLAVQAAKQAVLSRFDWPLEIALTTRYEPIEGYAGSEDVNEGRAAFAERRPPEWRGR